MDLDALRVRKSEIESAITQTTNSVYTLQGHLQEVAYQMKLAEDAEAAKLAEITPESEEVLETPVENPVE